MRVINFTCESERRPPKRLCKDLGKNFTLQGEQKKSWRNVGIFFVKIFPKPRERNEAQRTSLRLTVGA